jgi:hypothetical protein
MSWHNETVSKQLKLNGGKVAKELLNNAVLYKVGHHGSHNGTASKSGLENMTNKKLVAMMPLVQDKVPAQWGGAKNFPAKKLYAKLIEKTNGAVLRTDEGAITDANAKTLRQNRTADDQKALIKANKNLYQEWTIKA